MILLFIFLAILYIALAIMFIAFSIMAFLGRNRIKQIIERIKNAPKIEIVIVKKSHTKHRA